MKPKICLISDVPGWAFDQNNHDLAEYLSDSFEFSHFYVRDYNKGLPNWNQYDGIFELYHKNPGMGLPYSKTAGALRSEWFHPEHPGLPTVADVVLVNRYAMFQVAVKRNYDELIAKCPNVMYLTNPVNMHRFSQPTPLHSQIVAEWNGNSAHKAQGRFSKHFHDIIILACQKAEVKLVSAEYNTLRGEGRRREPNEMPDFYRQANVALCASEYEAASNSVMEAMAAGLAVIATDVGNHREMRDAQIEAYGDTGILLVERSVDAFVEALRNMTPLAAASMGLMNRASIQKDWSWDAWAPKYKIFLQRTIDSSKMPKIKVKEIMSSKPTDKPTIKSTAAPAISAVPVDFSYWNGVDPTGFLADDWDNPSRAWVGQTVRTAISNGCRTMVEAGPGVGVDYERQFKQNVLDGSLKYSGFEGSSNFCRYLQQKHPEAAWENRPLTDLPQQAFDIVYTRAVLEHQPALEPSLSCLLAAAARRAIIIWYRRPAVTAIGEKVDGVYYHTFKRDDVLSVIAREGWKIVEETPFDSGNLGWVLERA